MGRGRMIGVAAMAALLPTGVAAQLAERIVCQEGVDPVGSLGITGIACERCQFSTNGKVHRATFWTEPTIEALDRSAPASRVLREGDVLVAVDGQLITTREGSERFSALAPDREARLRVRRNGKLMDLSVPVAKVCPTTKTVDMPVVVGRPVPVMPSVVAAPVVGVPTVAAPVLGGTSVGAAAPVAPSVSVAPALPPTPPAPEVAAPRASLGFGFRCSWCGWHSGEKGGTGRWEFGDPPEVVGLSASAKDGARGELEIGDRILEIDGVPLTDEEGGRRFAAIRPGDALRWTVLRDGRRIEATTTARSLAVDVTTGGVTATHGLLAPLRFSGAVGNTTVEVRGGRVTVSEDEGGRLVIIRAGDTEIRIRTPGGEGG